MLVKMSGLNATWEMEQERQGKVTGKEKGES